MPSNIKIGLVYNYDENWIGGTYYIQNLICAFALLPDQLKPVLTVFTSNEKDYLALMERVTYPYLSRGSHPQYSFSERVLNKIAAILLKRRVIKKPYKNIDYLFPVGDDNLLPERPRKLFWIPDFQDHYLPAFFTQDELIFRKKWQSGIAQKKDAIVIFSSEAARRDYESIFPTALTRNFVVQFAVTHPLYQELDIAKVKSKYAISTEYFISPNQFWAHKNHRVIVEAVGILKKQGVDVCVVFTGKPHDYRNPTYYEDLRKYVSEEGLDDNILFLGFIERSDQLKLMQHAIAVIQPSKFEGWSTVVEDAKAMNQFVIASRIPVHVEQIGENGVFFDPDSAVELAGIMKNTYYHRPALTKTAYREKVRTFAMDFLKILTS